MVRKRYRAPMRFKEDGQPGEFSAVFSTFDVIDLDGDITLPGAFEEGAPVRIAAWSHGWSQLPVGRGIIHQTETEARVDGQFFLDTDTGREHYQTVKNLGDLQEWSYSFDILASEFGKRDDQHVQFLQSMKVHEVSPVMLGAGIDTRTLDIKGMKPYPNEHACRLRDPGDFQSDSFRRVSREHDDRAYGIIMGRLMGETTMTEQAYRYPTAGWSESQAKAHCQDHDGRFEAAEKKRQRVLREYLEEFGDLGGGSGETEDEAGDGKSREKPVEIIATRIALDMVEYGIPASEEGA